MASEIVGLISSIITIIDGTTQVYTTLKDAETQARKVNSSHDAKELKDLLKSCESKANELHKMFKSIQKKSADGKSLIGVYRSLVLKIGRQARVENVMQNILQDLTVLAAHRIFLGSMQSRVEEVKKAEQELTKAPPSMADSDFDEKPEPDKQIASRDINNLSGMARLEQVGRDNYRARGDMYIGRVPPYDSKRGKKASQAEEASDGDSDDD
ncbi:hypothetical protein F4801DRAFT_585671 [Xylaria longipes]|nr:hypothetical protein F4801DRAFT_585671 [Xylaria longipes]